MRLHINFLLLLASLVLGGEVLELTGDNFDELIINSGKPSLVEFYASWCGHCKRLAPTYDELAELFSEEDVRIAKIDADKHRRIGTQFNIEGFPTIKIFDGKGSEPVDYHGKRDLDSFASFIETQTTVKPKKVITNPDKSYVTNLDDITFDQVITDPSKTVLAAFTANWCGHCKNLVPVWEELAKIFKDEPDVVIAKIDTTAPNAKHIHPRFNVESYPTIMFFDKDTDLKKPDKHLGARDMQTLVNLVNARANTHRTVEGKLNNQAGRISKLDELILLYGTAAEKKQGQIANEIKSVAESLQDESVKYYLKVIDKLSKAPDYASKELTRLENILAKGNLAPEKQDNMIIRKNILSVFNRDKSDNKVKDEL